MHKTILFKNENVCFYDKGKGRAIVLLHGFLGSYEIWRATIENLSKTYRVIAIDLPGHGQTPSYGYVHSMELMAKCVKKVTDSLKLKKYVLIGHSMGGYVGLAFADLFPDNLKGLCLFHSSAYEDTIEKKTDRLRAIKLIRANKNIYTKDTILNLFSAKNLKYLKNEIQFALSIAKKTAQRGMIAALYGMRDRKSRELILGIVQYPIMTVIGEHDNVLPSELLFEQSNLIKNKTILYLENDGHFGFIESPIKTHKSLRKFLRICF